MRFLSVLLISFFVMSGVDFPFEVLRGKPAPSCCCKTGAICRCQHGGVSMCPMKRMKETQAAAQGQSHCDLQRAKALKEAAKKAVKKAESEGAPLFKSFGCGSSEEHKAAPTYSRDFIFDAQSHWRDDRSPQLFWADSIQNELPRVFYPIERPPQIFLRSI